MTTSPLDANQLDFLRPFSLAYYVPLRGWHIHHRQDTGDLRIALELILGLKRPLLIKHEPSGEKLALNPAESLAYAQEQLHLFYIKINDRGYQIIGQE